MVSDRAIFYLLAIISSRFCDVCWFSWVTGAFSLVSSPYVVCYTGVFSVVTQRSSFSMMTLTRLCSRLAHIWFLVDANNKSLTSSYCFSTSICTASDHLFWWAKVFRYNSKHHVFVYRCEQKTAKHSAQHVCVWDYDGTGTDYQLLAGPVFILVYTVSGIPLGFCAGIFHRRNLIVFCLLLWSTMTLLTGFATKYWHLVVTRFVLGIGWVIVS